MEGTKISFKIVEYFLRQVIEEGIDKIRANPDVIDDIFDDLTRPPLDKVFGKKIVNDIKEFFVTNDLPVLSAFSQNGIILPAITVHLISSQEDPEYRSMQDHAFYERTPKKAAIIAGPVYAKAYDSDSGKLTFNGEVDLSQFSKGRKLFAKRDDEVYTIAGTIKINTTDRSKDQYIHVVDAYGSVPERVDFAEMYLLSSVDFTMDRIAGAWFRETFEIRVNANSNSDQAIWLYYILAHIMMRNKQAFEDVGLENQTFSTSEFTRDVGKAPNTIWGRTLRFSFLVQHTWKEEVDVLELFQVNVNVETNVTRMISEV